LFELLGGDVGVCEDITFWGASSRSGLSVSRLDVWPGVAELSDFLAQFTSVMRFVHLSGDIFFRYAHHELEALAPT